MPQYASVTQRASLGVWRARGVLPLLIPFWALSLRFLRVARDPTGAGVMPLNDLSLLGPNSAYPALKKAPPPGTAPTLRIETQALDSPSLVTLILK